MTKKQAFQILEVDETASPNEIKQAWKDILFFWHPDKHQNNERRRRIAEEKTKQINEAFDRIQNGRFDETQTEYPKQNGNQPPDPPWEPPNTAKIQVTEEHIRQGKPKDTASCPIALAIKDDPKFEKMAGSVNELGVGYNYSLADAERTVVADVRKEGLLTSRYKLPDDALQFVKQFDKGQPVDPTEFELTKASVKKSAKKKTA